MRPAHRATARMVSASVLALCACSAGSGAPAAFADSATPAKRLPPGEYYVSFRPDRNELRYYALSGSRPGLAGRAFVNVGACSATTSPGTVNFDRQGRIDIFPPCHGGGGFVQVEAGPLGTVLPSRTIVTRFSTTATLTGDVDARGDVAIGEIVDLTTRRTNDTIDVYAPGAEGTARPLYRLRVFSRRCSEPISRNGPDPHFPGSPSKLAFDGGYQIVAQVGPGSESCGEEYVERFRFGTPALASWFVPGALAGPHREQISFVPGAFALERDGAITFGAYVGAAPTGRNGGVTYSEDAAGFQPAPYRIFTDAGAGLGESSPAPTVPIGIDRSGNVFLQNQPGGNVVVEFPRRGAGNIEPLETIRLPREVIGWPGTMVEVR